VTPRPFETILAPEAIAQIVEQSDYYLSKSGPDLAERWRIAVRDTARSLQTMPQRRPICRFATSRIQDVRRIQIPGFPNHSLFYKIHEQQREVHVLYMLHGARDIDGFFDFQNPEIPQ
jgi:plasmid stabilization system protein ParE